MDKDTVQKLKRFGDEAADRILAARHNAALSAARDAVIEAAREWRNAWDDNSIVLAGLRKSIDVLNELEGKK